MAASGNKSTGKMFPAATLEDNEKKEAGVEMKPIKISTPPFSSKNPATEGLRMKPLIEADADSSSVEDSEKKAADWKDEVEKAETQTQLDAVVERYEAAGADYKSVEDAVDKKQAELDGDDES